MGVVNNFVISFGHSLLAQEACHCAKGICTDWLTGLMLVSWLVMLVASKLWDVAIWFLCGERLISCSDGICFSGLREGWVAYLHVFQSVDSCINQ